jgi:CHAD domain-containing protein
VTSVGALVRDYVRGESEALATALQRPDDAAAVHRARVAARRLRSVLGAYSAVVPDTGPLRHELRWLGACLAELRRLDVLAGEHVGDPEILAEIRRQRDDALARTGGELAGPRVTHLLSGLEELVGSEGWSELPAERVTRRVLSRELERVLGRAEVAHHPGPDRDARLHDVRKAAKRLRYAAELARPVLPAAAEVAARAERVQELLGARNDVVSARAWRADLSLARPDLAARIEVPGPADLAEYDAALAALVR